MKKILAILFVLLICAPAAFADGDGYWTTNEDPYYHVDPACRGAKGMLPISMEGAAEFDKFPCPICRPESINVRGPAWCADPATYNSQMDAYKDGHAILVGDTVYYTDLYGWDNMGELLIRMDAYGDSSTAEIVCYLPDDVRISGSHGSFAYEDDMLYLDYTTGNVHRLALDGSEDRVLFTTKEADPPFLLLVGDRFYSAEGKTVGYYSIPDGSFTPLCEIDVKKPWDWNVVYAEGRLIVGIYAERGAFVSIDTATGESIDLTATFASAAPFIHQFLAIHGRIYIDGKDGVISANYDGTDVQTHAMIHADSTYSIYRAYDRYVFVTDETYWPFENIFISQQSGELRFEPTEMQRALYFSSMFCLGSRIYIDGVYAEDGRYIEIDNAKLYFYDSYDLREYIAELMASPLDEHVYDGW